MEFSTIKESVVRKEPISLALDYNGEVVGVKQYLPLEDKLGLIEGTVLMCKTDSIVEETLLKAMFELNMVLKYSDIVFTKEDKKDRMAIYDALYETGILNQIITAIPKSEKNILEEGLAKNVKSYISYSNSAKSIVDTLVTFAPASAELTNTLLKDIDMEKANQLINLGISSGMASNATPLNRDNVVPFK